MGGQKEVPGMMSISSYLFQYFIARLLNSYLVAFLRELHMGFAICYYLIQIQGMNGFQVLGHGK